MSDLIDTVNPGDSDRNNWPLMEAVGLLGQCRYRMTAKIRRHGAKYMAGTLDDIARHYGRRFQRTADALPFMEQIVAD